MFYVYVIRSGAHLYTGFTNDLRKRLKQHNAGQNSSTKFKEHWEVIYYEAHTSEIDAKRREGYLKTAPGKRALKRMLRTAIKSEKSYFDD